jgi:RimJ/RimL family protein N-acetyltransferase
MAAGATAGLVEARRLLGLHKVPAGEFARLRQRAAAAATGYTIVSWAGPAPEEYLSLVAAAFNAMNDAPSDEGWEEEIWDADRVRDRAGRIVRLTGVRGYSVAALHDATGELAALTQEEVDPERPDWGYQGLTAVTRPHRGHRLGLLAKATMMEWLATAEPQLERVVTGNAASNQHMIAVNETLGYELYPPGWQFCEIPVKSALQAVPWRERLTLPRLTRSRNSSGCPPGGSTTAASNLSRLQQAFSVRYAIWLAHRPPSSCGITAGPMTRRTIASVRSTWSGPSTWIATSAIGSSARTRQGSTRELPALTAHLTIPMTRTRGGPCKTFVTSAGPSYRQTGRRLGLAGRTKGKSPGVNPAPSRRVRPHGQSA